MESTILDWIIKLGFPAAIALWLIWQGRKDYALLVARLSQSEDWIRETLVAIQSETAAALRDNSAALREWRRSNNEIIQALQARPCLMPDYEPHPARRQPQSGSELAQPQLPPRRDETPTEQIHRKER